MLTHYHAVRVLGASAYGAGQVIMSEAARAMVTERGQVDWDSEFGRFPRLFQGHEEITGLTWPTTTFNGRMSVWLGRRRVDLLQLGRAHTAGDIVVHVPDQNVMFTGDIVEAHSACYCGDGHFADWGGTLEAIRAFDLDAIAPGRGDAVVGRDAVDGALERTRDFVASTYAPVARIAAPGRQLKEAWEAVRAECDPKFRDYAIYEHCLPFNVARAWDEARGIAIPGSGPPSATARCGPRFRLTKGAGRTTGGIMGAAADQRAEQALRLYPYLRSPDQDLPPRRHRWSSSAAVLSAGPNPRSRSARRSGPPARRSGRSRRRKPRHLLRKRTLEICDRLGAAARCSRRACSGASARSFTRPAPLRVRSAA